MKRVLLFLICALSLIVTEVKAENLSLSLAGVWKSSLGECVLPGSTDENHLGDGVHRTDVTTELTRLWPFEGVVDYERTIDLPESMAGDSLELRLERTKPSTLWVDGDSIGHLGHLYAAHVYHIGPLEAGKHTIKIRIDNSATSVPQAIQGSHAWTNATQTNWNGILGEMTLKALPSTRIIGLQVYLNDAALRKNRMEQTCGSSQSNEATRADGAGPDNAAIRAGGAGPDNAAMQADGAKPLNVATQTDRTAQTSGVTIKNDGAVLQDNTAAVLKVKIQSGKAQEVALLMEGDGIVTKKVFLALEAGVNETCIDIVFDGEPVLWSEFHPHLYSLKVGLETKGKQSGLATDEKQSGLANGGNNAGSATGGKHSSLANGGNNAELAINAKKAGFGMEAKNAAQEKEAKNAAQEKEAKSAVQEKEAKNAAQETEARNAVQETEANNAVQETESRNAAQEKESRNAAQEKEVRKATPEKGETTKTQELSDMKEKLSDMKEVTFGLRKFATEDKCFTINGYKTFMRGTHDGCVFPLTGYCPTDTATWMRVFRIAKAYGLNHFRFHSYTPTEAAFVAADKLGFYLQVELPIWGQITPETKELNAFLLREAEDILEQFGNHPSMMAVGIGNELNGDHEFMRTWLDGWREKDPRHLYVFGSNNTLGWQGVHQGEDYMVTCRVGGNSEGEEDPYKYHTRSSFSFADADEGGLLNNTHPNTLRHFGAAVGRCEVPIISHESCQFQIYPDYTELPKYTGVLYPYSLEIFRDRLGENHLTDQIEAFHQANGRFAAACDKADIEYCLRTYTKGGGFGGYQILDLKDYTGQGSALCGILDSHMDSKGIITEKEWGEFVAPVVPLALMEKHCWSRDEVFRAGIDVCNFLEADLCEELTCTLEGGHMKCEMKTDPITIRQGGARSVFTFECPLKHVIKRPSKLTFTVQYGGYTNHYDVWVYPQQQEADNATKPSDNATKPSDNEAKPSENGLIVTDRSELSNEDEAAKLSENGLVVTDWSELSDEDEAAKSSLSKEDDVTKPSKVKLIVTKDLKEALSQLHRGRTVLFQATDTLIAKHSVGGLFTPDYWNYAMFKTISENNHRLVSPGTMGLLMDPEHPLFQNFPTEGRSNWQWWPVARFSRPLILDAISADYRPTVQAIDNVERNHLLGILMEFKVGKGKLLLTTTDLEQIAQWPEGKAYTEALELYAKSEQFQPAYGMTADDLISLLTDAVQERSIKGVKNISDYKH